ncbi:ABC transporter permease [Corynebacterium sp. TAE3-ERU12]|uniref:ABC transporter permease n=1 Tax=Corynebacterium sp. TAE3-ERU12 TaxID=2849491 RepID=UPI001C446F84|nr:ABC transporter permease [Corynebacterium sp. TAE3-ERU12]MBV7294957.1 ABC transporter permease [Corynebacterium sp. TAE3-ERU12]
MMNSKAIPVWGYHAKRQLRSTGTWLMACLVAVLAVTQGILTEHMLAIMEKLGGEEMVQLISSTLPEPSWQQSYAGWVKSLSQVISIAIITFNALSCASLTSNGDIPFILTRNVRRSHYFVTSVLTTWLTVIALAFVGATLTWAGTAPLFPDAPYSAVLSATLVWALEIIMIHAAQLLAVTIKKGIAPPLLTGLGLYLLVAIAGAWGKLSAHTPLGVATLSHQLSGQVSNNIGLWPVISSLMLTSVLVGGAVYRFNRMELA